MFFKAGRDLNLGFSKIAAVDPFLALFPESPNDSRNRSVGVHREETNYFFA